MKERPIIGQRVRMLGNTGLPGVAGRVGTVVEHHHDGISFMVRLVSDAPGDRPITCDPINVQPAARNS